VKRVTPLHELDQPQDVVLADVAAELPPGSTLLPVVTSAVLFD